MRMFNQPSNFLVALKSKKMRSDLFELDNLGDLSRYTFIEMANKLQGFQIRVTPTSDTNFIADFESRNSLISIIYSSNGDFIRIVNDLWK